MFTQLATYCNTGADIAGMGWGFGFGVSRYFVQSGVGDGSEGNPYELDLSEDFYTTSVNRFSTTYSAAYVAGAASIVFQALSFVNGVPPSDDEVETILLDTIQFPGMAGILDGGGYLNANAAAMDAIAGGTLFQYEPAMAFTTTTAMFEWFSQNRAAVTRGTDLSVSPTIVNGTAPFTLEVDWNNGEDPVEVTNWNSGDTVTLTGGYDALGLKYISLTVIDANAQTITITPDIFVINPLVATINVENGAGDILPTPPSLKTGTTYRFRPAINNLFTGDLGGTPNEVSYEWWFESDPAADPRPMTGMPRRPGGLHQRSADLRLRQRGLAHGDLQGHGIRAPRQHLYPGGQRGELTPRLRASKSPGSRKAPGLLFFKVSRPGRAGRHRAYLSLISIAPVGHSSTHAPHAVHRLGSTTAQVSSAFIEIASVGHTSMQAPHAVHMSQSTNATSAM